MALQRNIILSVLGAIVQRGAGLLGGIYVARYLGGEVLGGYALILANIYMFGAFATFGITPVASKFVSENRGVNDSIIINIIATTFIISSLFGLVLSLFIYSFSEYIALHLYSRPEFELYLKISAPSILFMALSACNVGILSGYEKFRIVSKHNAVNGIMSTLLIILFGTMWEVKGIAIAILLSQFIFFAVTLVPVLPYLNGLSKSVKSRLFMNQWSIMASFSIPHFLTGLSQGLTNWLCILFLSKTDGGLNELALFHIANQWYSLILFLPNVAATVLLPYLSREGSSSLVNIIKAYAVAIVAAVGLLVFATPLISTLYGEVLYEKGLILIITFVTGGVVAFKSPIEQSLLAHNKVWLLFKINMIFLSVFLVGAYTLLNMGTLGVLSARLIGYVLFCFMIFSAYLFMYGKKQKYD
ncbi:MAG: oligosaccharide flippase family protein [Pseudomonas sp.]|nr:oligosaccharide flippase family protein [Pseudomonas sp.]